MEQVRRYILQPWVQASFTATIAFAVYVRTLAPTVMWYDMGEFATASYVLGVAHNTGYPLYLLLGKLFTLLPIGDIAYRVNLMSAFFGAMTVFLLYLIVNHLTLRRSAAFFAALTIAVTSTLWSNATWAVSYDLNAFLTLLILFLLMKWRASGLISNLYLAVLTFGLSLGNHRLILVMLVPLAYSIWLNQRTGLQRLERKQFLLLGLLFLVGFSVNLYLPIRASQIHYFHCMNSQSLDL
jgi:asparagine N-glycosylation enzyme membrane subunit Stt3